MDDVAIARAIHVLAVVHWIGGVSMVTAVILPSVERLAVPSRRLARFEEIEGRFSGQAKISVTLAGISGFYMTERLGAWDRFLDSSFWWMHAMVLVWAIFMFVLFVAEPLFVHRWFHERATKNPETAFAIVRRVHWILLSASAVTIAAAILGAHGML